MKLLTISAFVILLGFVGQSDFDEQHGQRKHYCDMVAKGAWPAYDGEC